MIASRDLVLSQVSIIRKFTCHTEANLLKQFAHVPTSLQRYNLVDCGNKLNKAVNIKRFSVGGQGHLLKKMSQLPGRYAK